MKRLIAGIVAGLLLGVSGTALAAESGYWEGHGSGYHCSGIASGVQCDSGRYQVGATRSFVYIQEHGTKMTYACYRWQPFSHCVSG